MRAQLPIGRLLGSGGATNSYSPDFTAPPGEHEHITVHDLAWLHPEAHTPPALASYLGPVVDRAIRRSTTVFTVSETVRTEVIDRYDLPPDQVLVATNAAASAFFGAESLTKEELASLTIREPFLLYVGSIEPRKNLPVLLEALAMLPEELTLVVVGNDGGNAEQQLSVIERLNLQQRVARPGFLPDEQLIRLYASAAAVVYPSRHEGFGLPVIEGMAAGVPVVASDLPVFREVGGDAVTYFDPVDTRSLVEAIDFAISSDASGEVMREVRRTQARRFDWQTSAAVVARRLQKFA